VRVLLVNSAIPTMFGGGEKWFVEAAGGLRARGHDVVLVGRPDSRLLATAATRGTSVRSFGFGGDFDPVASVRAAALLRRERPDVVLVNFNKDAWLFGRGAKLFGIPIVARHGLMAYKRKFHYRLLHRWHVDRLVVNAPAILERYARLGFDVDHARVILNGVHPPTPKPGELRARFGLPDAVPVVVTFGRLANQKQLDVFVRVARRIADVHPTTRFVVMGDGAVRERLEGWIDDAGLRENFVVAGFVDDAASLAGDADLFLLTSKNEGTPNALLEAMAAGTCCLSFDVGSVPMVLGDDLESAVLAPDDEEGMASRALELLSDDAARRDLAARQRERIERRFTFERAITAYEELLEDVIAH
jgi:glycosyltransferase involved in cell wall biosynthesis